MNKSKICFITIFLPRLNTIIKSSYFASIFTQANPNTVYGSILKNNMDDSSFNPWKESLIKTISLPRQAFGQLQTYVESIPEAACKVSLYLIICHYGIIQGVSHQNVRK